MTEEEKSAISQLFLLKSLIRERVHEWDVLSQKSKHPGTKRFYRYFSVELEGMLRDFDRRISAKTAQGFTKQPAND